MMPYKPEDEEDLDVKALVDADEAFIDGAVGKRGSFGPKSATLRLLSERNAERPAVGGAVEAEPAKPADRAWGYDQLRRLREIQEAKIADAPAKAPSQISALRGAASKVQLPPELDEELSAAQTQDRQLGGLDRASDALYSAFSGTPIQFRSKDRGGAGDLLERRGQERQGREDARLAEERQRKLEAEQAAKDPASEESQRARDFLKFAVPGIDAEMGEHFDRLSKAQASEFFPFLKEGLEGRSAKAKAIAAAEAEKAKQTEENRRRGEDRGWAVDDVGKKRAFESEQARLDRESRERAAALSASTKATSEVFKNTSDLRKELSGSPAGKQFQEVAVAYDKVQRAAKNPSAAGDLSLIFAYMKMLDPGSSVREGEFANAQNAAGVPTQIVNAYNKAQTGQRLAPEQRADFINQAKGLYDAQASQFDRIAGQYRGFAEKAGGSPDDVVPQFGAPNTSSHSDTVMVQPPGGGSPVAVHRSKLQKALDAGGKVVAGGG